MSPAPAVILWITTAIFVTIVLHLFSPEQPTKQRADTQLGACVIAGIAAGAILLLTR